MPQAIERVLSEDVLDKTMRLFWARGYAHTPIEDIVAVTGFNRAAIYNRFGGKRGLFLAMLERYRERITARVLEPLRTRGADIDAIETFFRGMSESPELTRQSLGCMLVATASDPGSLDEPASTLVNAYLEEMTTLFRKALQVTRRQGRLEDAVDIAASADFLAGNVLGLMTLSRWPAPGGAFDNQLGEILRYLDRLEKASEQKATDRHS